MKTVRTKEEREQIIYAELYYRRLESGNKLRNNRRKEHYNKRVI